MCKKLSLINHWLTVEVPADLQVIPSCLSESPVALVPGTGDIRSSDQAAGSSLLD